MKILSPRRPCQQIVVRSTKIQSIENVNACPLECYDRSQDASLSISRSNREYMSSGENVRGDDERGRGHMPRV